MKLHATISEFDASVEMRREGKSVFARVNETEYQVEANERGTGSYLVTVDGKVFDCRVESRPCSGKAINVFVGAEQFSVTLTDPKRLRGAADAMAHGDGAVRILAPMPGKVVRMLVEVGAQVEAGAGIVVVEAMKMQNEMKSPKGGVVAAINVATGSTVNGGEVLAIIE